MAEKLFGKGDYAGALKEYEAAALLLPGNPLGDKALFSMGIIWADPENPRRDYSKAFGYFERLVSDFPQSALMKEARVLMAAIKEITLHENMVTELEGTLTALQKEAADLKETDAKAGEKNKDLEETIKALKRQVNSLKETGAETEAKNRDLEETVRTLKNQINALKEIDLGIEGKKR
jgi:tetratricopeptide (TPR) repeat protein